MTDLTRTLRLKISLIAFAAFFLVTGAIIGGLNYKMNTQVITSAHKMLTVLSENNGTLPHVNAKPNADTTAGSTQNSSQSGSQSSTQNGSQSGSQSSSQSGAASSNSQPGDSYDLGFDSKMNIETQYTTRYFYVVLNADGSIASDNLDHIAAVSRDDLTDFANETMENPKTEGWITYFRYLKVPVGQQTTIYYVDCYNQKQYVRYLTKMSLMIAGIGMIFASIFVYLFSGKAIEPLEESFQRQKRFVTDASHELKTPLAAISANVDVLELQYGENDTTKRIRNQVTHLSTLVNEMLTLSRVTSTTITKEESEDLDLSTMARSKVSEFLPIIETQGKHITCNISENTVLTGNRSDIDRLLSVLLDNAVKYCLPDGSIQVSAGTDKKTIRFSVTNSSEPITPNELNHLFDRFYRTDHSRSRDTGSYGIGLSIAAAIVQKHHGRITARNVPDGVRFECEFPAKVSLRD